MLLFLYNCGARVSETADVRWNDVQLVSPRQVRLRGKGKKDCLLPLWRETADVLHRLRGMAMNRDQQHVFVNRHGQTDPARNGKLTPTMLVHRFEIDEVVGTGYQAGGARTAAPMPRQDIVAAVKEWAAAGAPCPDR